MSAAEKLPPEELAITSDECAALWGMSRDWWLRTIACQPGFPQRIAKGVWIAGEVLQWRRDHRHPDSPMRKKTRTAAGLLVPEIGYRSRLRLGRGLPWFVGERRTSGTCRINPHLP